LHSDIASMGYRITLVPLWTYLALVRESIMFQLSCLMKLLPVTNGWE